MRSALAVPFGVFLLACGGGTRSVRPAQEAQPSGARFVWNASQFVGLFGASVSTDGRYLLYTDWTSGDLVARDLRTEIATNITNKPATAFKQFAESFMRLSNDGSRFVYVWDRQPHGYELRTIGRDGSGVRAIYALGHNIGRAYDLSPDGRKVAIVQRDTTLESERRTQIILVAVDDGRPTAVAGLGGAAPERMTFSPDGGSLAYDIPARSGSSQRDVFVIDAQSGERTAALDDSSDIRLLGWSPDAKWLVTSSDGALSLHAVQRGRTVGAPLQLRVSLPDRAVPLGVTASGSLYYGVPETRRLLYLAELDVRNARLASAPVAVSTTGNANEGADWSPDGSSLAYVRDGRTLVARNASGAERTVATVQGVFTPGWGDRYVRWSPDGTRLLVPQGGSLFVIDANTGELARMRLGIRARYGRWSRDGKSVYFARLSGDTTTTEIVRRDLEAQREVVIYRSPADLARAHDDFHSLELSPDEQWVAFAGAATTTDGDTRLTVVPTRGGNPHVLLQVPSAEFLNVVGWTPDSRYVLFTRDGKFAARRSRVLWMMPVAGGTPRRIDLTVNVLTSVRFHPDGRRVVFDSGDRGGTIWAVDDFLPREAPAKHDSRTQGTRPEKHRRERSHVVRLRFASGQPLAPAKCFSAIGAFLACRAPSGPQARPGAHHKALPAFLRRSSGRVHSSSRAGTLWTC